MTQQELLSDAHKVMFCDEIMIRRFHEQSAVCSFVWLSAVLLLLIGIL